VDCMNALSLEGIQSKEKKKLTAVSPDVFISIPTRDSGISFSLSRNLTVE